MNYDWNRNHILLLPWEKKKQITPTGIEITILLLPQGEEKTNNSDGNRNHILLLPAGEEKTHNSDGNRTNPNKKLLPTGGVLPVAPTGIEPISNV